MLTKDKNNAVFFGVCGGVAKATGISPIIIRLLTVLAFFMTGSLVGLAYILAALILPNEE